MKPFGSGPFNGIRLGLTARLMAAMVLMAIAVVILDTTLTRWAFQARFLSYVNEQEQEAIAGLSERLQEMYAATGDWRALDTRRDLARLLTEDLREQPRARESARGAVPMGRFRTTRLLLPRLHLLDADGNVVVGDQANLPEGRRVHRSRIIVDGEIAGTLVIAPLHGLARESDRRFAAEYTRTMWWIAALASVLACAVGLALARYLLAPVRDIARGARELAQGRYETRLSVDRNDELGALARDFNVLAAGLESSRESRQRWLADVAHELRTPLAVLRAEIEALRDGIRPLDQAAMSALAGEAERLGHLADDLHELSLADAGALSYHFTRIDPLALLETAAERFQSRMELAGLTLEFERPAEEVPALLGDEDRLGQLLANLLENSLRYTESPGLVRLALECGVDRLTIHVEDGPPGVPEAEIPALFERFTRRESARDRASGGSGLGLAIARRIAEAHGGTLDAGSSALGGVHMLLCLPLTGPEPPP